VAHHIIDVLETGWRPLMRHLHDLFRSVETIAQDNAGGRRQAIGLVFFQNVFQPGAGAILRVA
jgi:hypothetical protein